MEVDPPKEEAEKKEGDAAAAAAAASTEGGGKEATKNEDAEMKDDSQDKQAAAEGKLEEPPAKKEVKTEKRKKVVSKTIDLPVTPRVVGALSRDKLEAALVQEKTLADQDTYESNRLVAKNAVEEYIYNIREKISEVLEDYITEPDREVYSKKLTETEDWLYEDGEDCEKSVYEDRLKDLKMVGEAAKKRKSEYEGRKAAVDTLGHTLQMAAKMVDLFRAGDEKYNHLTDAEVDKVAKLIDEKRTWLNNSVATLEKTVKTTNPTILNCQFYSEKDSFEYTCRPIVNKPKPKVEPPPKEEPKKEAKAEAAAKKSSKAEAAADEEAAAMEDASVNGNGDPQEPPMDLD
jgi:hypothetical protein